MGSNGKKPKRATSNKNGDSPSIEVRRSGVHGQGVFTTQKIKKGRRVIEYVGERMPWDVASATEDPDDPHTFLFGLSDDNLVINAAIGGNESRWINHSCDPNCEAIEETGRVFIYALRDVQPGEELFYDYGLEIDEPRTPEMEKQFQCHCGTKKCRGTLLSQKEAAAAGK